jgi:hypothetical protein
MLGAEQAAPGLLEEVLTQEEIAELVFVLPILAIDIRDSHLGVAP